MIRKVLIICVFLFLGAFCLSAQQSTIISNIEVSNTKAHKLGTVQPDFNKYKGISSIKKQARKKLKRLPPNFVGRGTSKVVKPELEHQGADPLRSKGYLENSKSLNNVIVEQNMDGLIARFGSPHDPSGAAGPNHYVQVINATEIGVFDKTGDLEVRFTGNDLWTPLNITGVGDPIVLFDLETNKWIITEFADPAILLFGISKTSDPLGAYDVYSFATPQFPDYPKYGIWNDFITVTTNEVAANVLHQYFLDKNALMSGAETVDMQRIEINNAGSSAGFFVSTPVHWGGGTMPTDNNPIVMKINDSSWGEVAQDGLDIYTFDVDLSDASNTQVTRSTLTTTPFDTYPCDRESGGFACLSQGGDGTNGLDGIPDVIMNLPHYRNFGTHESIVLNFITDVTDGENLSGIRWMELRRENGGDWEIYQEGTFSPDDGLHRFMGSIAMDAQGNIALAYSVSSPSTFAGLRVTGRFATDPLGQMTFAETVLVDGTNPSQTDRFGDYPQMVLDAADDQLFWFTSEYAGEESSNQTKTRIAAFRLSRFDNDINVFKINQPETGANLTATENVKVDIINQGNLDATNFTLKLFVDDVEVESYLYTETLASTASYEHTFDHDIDLSVIGSTADIKVIAEYSTDENLSNNEASVTTRHLAAVDASISISGQDYCSDRTFLNILINNQGVDTIKNLSIQLLSNDVIIDTINWAGEIARDGTERIEFEITSLSDDMTTVTANTLLVNGGEDDLPADNTASTILQEVDGGNYRLIVNLDAYPTELTAVFANADSSLISEYTFTPADSNSTVIIDECLLADGCYFLGLLDSGFDGVCCDYGEGSIFLVGPEGDTISSVVGEEFVQLILPFCGPEVDGNDVSLSFSLPAESCVSSEIGLLSVTNVGGNEITSFNIEIARDGQVVLDSMWQGSIESLITTQISIPINDLAEGDNSFTVTLTNVNGAVDPTPENNVATADISYTASSNNTVVRLSIDFDDYPEELSWSVTDSNGAEVASNSAPYPVSLARQSVSESICVTKDECYTLNIFDSIGDGICCDYGNGSYSLVNAEGIVIASGAQYGDKESTNFCLGEGCNLSIEISKSDINDTSNGSIMITASGSLGYEYSIDGGSTFQLSNVFDDLDEGSYDVVVKDEYNCSVTETVAIISTTSIEDYLQDLDIFVAPNPTTGLLDIRIPADGFIGPFLTIQVFDSNGRLIQNRRFGNYDDEFVGQISLYDYPSGIYYLHPIQSDRLIKVIKQ